MAIRIGKFKHTQSFKKDIKRLPSTVQAHAKACVRDLLSNPIPPSRQLKKRKGKRKNGPDIWQARVTRDVRLTFEMDEDTAVLRRIGSHNRIEKHD